MTQSGSRAPLLLRRTTETYVAAFRAVLKEAVYVDGENVTIATW
jgi:hypothetical protein